MMEKMFMNVSTFSLAFSERSTVRRNFYLSELAHL